MNVWLIEKPPGYDWGYPGYMSIYVGYGSTADFFYSGHVGICMLHFLEFQAVGWICMSYYCLFVMFIQTFTMVALRSHYTVDMISGMIFAHYIWILCERYIYIWDWHCLGIPLEKRMAESVHEYQGEHPAFNSPP